MRSVADTAGRAPRISRFAPIKSALARQRHDITRALRRYAATQLPTIHRDAPRGALQAGIEPLRLLQGVLDRADLIALDVPRRGRVRHAHLLVTLPITLLERATVIASYDVDDEETGDIEYTNDAEPSGNTDSSADEEASLGLPDGVINQTHPSVRDIAT